MLTGRPTPAPGREAGLDPGPDPGGERCSPWSRNSKGASPPFPLSAPRVTSTTFSHSSQPPVCPCSLVFPNFRKGDCGGAPPKRQLTAPPKPGPTSRDPNHSAPNSRSIATPPLIVLCSSSPSSPSISSCSAPPTPRPTLLPSTPTTQNVRWPQDLDQAETLELSRIGLQLPQPDTHTPPHRELSRHTPGKQASTVSTLTGWQNAVVALTHAQMAPHTPTPSHSDTNTVPGAHTLAR